MKNLWVALTAALLLGLAAGCGGSGEKGQNRDKDKPRAGDTSAQSRP